MICYIGYPHEKATIKTTDDFSAKLSNWGEQTVPTGAVKGLT